MTATRTLLDRLLHCAECYDAIAELEALCHDHPPEGSAVAWDYLMRVDPWLSDMGVDAEMVRLFLESAGIDGIDRLLREWPRLNENQKRAICHGAYLAEAMPESVAIRLFYAPGSSVSDRHLIIAGLASTAPARHCEATVLGLVEKVGTYSADFAHRQSSLDSLREGIKRSFVANVGRQSAVA